MERKTFSDGTILQFNCVFNGEAGVGGETGGGGALFILFLHTRLDIQASLDYFRVKSNYKIR